MKLKLFIILSIAMLFIGCSTTASSDSPITGQQTTLAGIKTCLKSSVSSQSVPAGTIAKRLSDGATAQLDAKGCYELPSHGTVFARSFADSTNDSVQLYNDSALFAITIPYITAGDTISISPTLVTLQDAPNAEVDSVLLVVFDKTHLLSRKVKLRVADYGDSSSYSRTLWIRDNSTPVKVHLQISGTRTFASSVITVQPGAAVVRAWKQIKEGAVPTLTHGVGSFVSGGHKYISLKLYQLDTIVDTTMKTIKFKTSSIYGIRSILVDGVEDSVLRVESIVNSWKKFKITMNDSAGYSYTDSMIVYRQDGTLQSVGNCGIYDNLDQVIYTEANGGVYMCVEK
jgi:hypothetical protein